MRFALFFLPFLAFAAALMPAQSEGASPPDNNLAKALELPQQSEQSGVTDLLWQTGYSYPGGQFYILTHFPHGLGEAVDSAVARFAKEQFEETCSSFMSLAADTVEEARAAFARGGQPLPEFESGVLLPYFSVFNYQLFRPSERYVSIYYMGSEYTGGAHGNRFHVVLSYDLQSGARLRIEDLFLDKDAYMPQLINRIADGIQAMKAADAEPVDRDPASIDATMDRIALTHEGIRVVYAPYEMGSYAEGDFIVDIPKEELFAMGVKRDFWAADAAPSLQPLEQW